jgi:hypothetical protein
VNKQGGTSLINGETVSGVTDGRDMVAELHEIKPQSPIKREWHAEPMDIQVDADVVKNPYSEASCCNF